MKLKARLITVPVGKRLALLHEEDAKRSGILSHNRVKINHRKQTTTAFTETTNTYLQPGEIGITKELQEELKIKDGNLVSVSSAKIPESIKHIHKKMRGQTLTKDEIYNVINDIANHKLSEIEITELLMAEEFHGLNMDEIVYITKAMVDTGTTIDFGRPCYDKHSVGGVPGNKVTLLIVPIVAAAGLLIPKTSSRAVTSSSGTVDTMEVLADVEFTASELKEIALKAGGAIAWGGKLGIAPADDILIRVEYPLSIDPTGQMLASIMAKKLAVGADCVVIDIPVGIGAKVEKIEDARKLAQSFVELGNRFNVQVQCGITYGGQLVGHSVGPALEAREALLALQGKGPASLIEKSTALAGILLEMGGVASPNEGKEVAKEILFSRKALKKMKEIIEIQGGDPKIEPEKIPIGEHSIALRAPCDGFVTNVDNAAITAITRASGAPIEKGAGVALRWKRGYKVKKDDVLLEIYAEQESKLAEAYNVALRTNPVTVEGMLLHRIPEQFRKVAYNSN
ncbi:MAG: AMP phosphorylase [Candidatus Bathyarchaeota archaeon]|nr:AMP phosphorylase [Candidatus Bathyarchaeota archaeon]